MTPYLFQMRLELMAQLSNFLAAYNFTNDKRFSLTARQCLHYAVNVTCIWVHASLSLEDRE